MDESTEQRVRKHLVDSQSQHEPTRDAAYYDTLADAVELPDDPKPYGGVVEARARAIREGRLFAPQRDELEAAGLPAATTWGKESGL